MTMAGEHRDTDGTDAWGKRMNTPTESTTPWINTGRSTRRELVVGGFSAAFAAYVLTACGGDKKNPTSATGSTSGDAPDESSPPAPALRVISVSLDTTVDLLDPQAFRTFSAQAVTAALYPALLAQEFKSDGEGGYLGQQTYGPGLAQSLQFSDDRLTATFALREDAQFADGSPVTIDDVLWTFERSIVGPGYIKALLPFIGIESMDQITADTATNSIIFRPSVASPLFERFIALQAFGIMEKSLGEGNAVADDEWAFKYFRDNAGGAGPYAVGSYDRDTQIVLEPNEGYYDAAKVANSGVTVRNVPDPDQRALLLRSGELDVVQGIPPQQLADLESDPDLVVYRQPSISTNFLGMNSATEPFANINVRRAVAAAIPYQVLIDQVMYGYASPAGNLVVANMDTHADIVFKTDLEAAAALLEGVELPSSIPLSIKQSSARDQRSAVFIQDSLREVGINIEIQVLPDAQFVENLNAKSLTMFIHEWLSWGGDPYYQMKFLAGTGVFTNFVSYSNTELDSLLTDGLFELDSAKRASISAQAQQILHDEAPIVPLFSPDWVVVSRSNVTGISKGDDEKLRFELIRKA